MAASSRDNSLTGSGKLATPFPILFVTDIMMDKNVCELLIPFLTGLKPFGYNRFLGDTCEGFDLDHIIRETEGHLQKLHDIATPGLADIILATKHFIDGCEKPDVHAALIDWMKERLTASTDAVEIVSLRTLLQCFLLAPEEDRGKESLKMACDEFTQMTGVVDTDLMSPMLSFYKQLKDNAIEYNGYLNTEILATSLRITGSLISGTLSWSDRENSKWCDDQKFQRLQRQGNAFVVHMPVATYLNLSRNFLREELKKFIVVYCYNIPSLQSDALQIPPLLSQNQLNEVKILRERFDAKCYHGVKLDCKSKSRDEITHTLIELVERQLRRMAGYEVATSVITGSIYAKKPITPGFKVVCIGQAGIGKTDLCLRLCKGVFIPSTEPTIGAAFYSLKLNNGSFEMWDPCGHSRYESLLPMYLRGAHAVLIAIDRCDEDALVSLNKYLSKIKTICGSDVKISIVVTRMDLVEEKFNLYDQILAFAKNWNENTDNAGYTIATYTETSAKNNLGIVALRNYLLNLSKPDLRLTKSAFSQEEPNTRAVLRSG